MPAAFVLTGMSAVTIVSIKFLVFDSCSVSLEETQQIPTNKDSQRNK